MSFQNCVEQLDTLELEDLPYIEQDLDFGQKASLAFLLFGDQHSTACYALQKLLTLSLSSSENNNNNSSSNSSSSHISSSSNSNINSEQVNCQHSDLLHNYAIANPVNWRALVIEALTIIGARRVLRKLGYDWEELRLHYLPHISEFGLHVHPLLKALYLMSEQLTVAQCGRLVANINDKRPPTSSDDHLRFYNTAHLEMFLLHWLCRRIISVGDMNANGSDIQILIEYLKFNDHHSLATLLVQTINSNAVNATTSTSTTSTTTTSTTVSNATATSSTNDHNKHCEADAVTEAIPQMRRPSDAFRVEKENAGIVLIINQQTFHTDVKSEEWRALLSKKKLEPRKGTDIDKQRLAQVFSAYGYQVESHDNVDHEDMLALIRDACGRTTVRDSLIVCLLTHGFEGAVFGADSIALRIADIENVMCWNPALRSKPKMLIIQACQIKDQNTETRDTRIPTEAVHRQVNVLKAMSTVAGFAALRHTQQGTWFIQSLCDAIVKYGDHTHMMDILTHVVRMVSDKRGDQNHHQMVPIITSTLRHPFYLPIK